MQPEYSGKSVQEKYKYIQSEKSLSLIIEEQSDNESPKNNKGLRF